MKSIVIFASGSGSNAENIITHFSKSKTAKVAAVFCNNRNAQVLERAKKKEVPTVVFSKEDFDNADIILKLNSFRPDLIVLAGFLLKFPSLIIEKYPNKIINIHPALLPKYGGKGMYGMHVHRAVLANKETQTGISIHFVNEHYDEGNIIFQKNILITDCETPEAIAARIHDLEQQYFPKIIEKLLM